jgi:hypothetical protein
MSYIDISTLLWWSPGVQKLELVVLQPTHNMFSGHNDNEYLKCHAPFA